MTVDALVCTELGGRQFEMAPASLHSEKAGCRAKATALHFRRRRAVWRLLVFERCAFAGNEDCSRRFDGEFFRVIALVDGDADAAARILIEKGFADGNVHEGFGEGKDERV